MDVWAADFPEDKVWMRNEGVHFLNFIMSGHYSIQSQRSAVRIWSCIWLPGIPGDGTCGSLD